MCGFLSFHVPIALRVSAIHFLAYFTDSGRAEVSCALKMNASETSFKPLCLVSYNHLVGVFAFIGVQPVLGIFQRFCRVLSLLLRGDFFNLFVLTTFERRSKCTLPSYSSRFGFRVSFGPSRVAFRAFPWTKGFPSWSFEQSGSLIRRRAHRVEPSLALAILRNVHFLFFLFFFFFFFSSFSASQVPSPKKPRCFVFFVFLLLPTLPFPLLSPTRYR